MINEKSFSMALYDWISGQLVTERQIELLIYFFWMGQL